MQADRDHFLHTYQAAATEISQAIKNASDFIAPTFPANDPLRQETSRFTAHGGKRLRPALSLVTARALGHQDVQPHLALETFHKYILVHDDIIDRDTLRYNAPTVHTKLEDLCSDTSEKVHFGNSLAIVAGDLLESATTKIILQSDLPDPTKLTLLGLVAQATDEVTKGWYDQFLMDYLPLGSSKLTFQRIEDSIIWVTGKYSIKLPLYFGYVVAGKRPPIGLERLADLMGALFQTGDDLIGLLGKTEDTGKSNFADITQGKKTLPMWLTYHHAPASQKIKLQRYVGNRDLTPQQVEEVRSIVRGGEGLERTKQLMGDYRAACQALLDDLQLPADLHQFLAGFITYLEHRDR